MSTQEIKRVGVIGLGKMGLPMARRLAERGFAVIGYDVALAALKAAAGAGVQPVNSPKAVAATSDLVIVVVGFDQEVEAVMFGENGMLAGAGEGAILAIASTIAPRTMKKLTARLPAKPAVTLLDIPLCRVDREALRAALLDSSAANWSLATRPEEKPMPWAEKDMSIVLKEADAVRMSVPLCGVVKEVIKTVKLERNWPTPKSPED